MFFLRKKSKKEQSLKVRHKRLHETDTQEPSMWKNVRVLLGGGFFLFSIIFISFWKQAPTGPQLFLNHLAKMKLVSAIDFEYESEIQTKTLRDQRRQMISPVYKINLESFHQFCQHIEVLQSKLNKIARITDTEARQTMLNKLINSFESHYGILLQQDDLEALLRIPTSVQRDRLIEEGIFVLQEAVQKGILNDEDFDMRSNENVYVSIAQNDASFVRLQTKGNALRALRMNLFVMDIEYDVANALMHILKFGLTPNVLYDKQKTEDKIVQFVEKTPNVVVHIKRGDCIVENGQIVTPEVYECFVAYQKNLARLGNVQFGFNSMLTKKIFLVCLLFICVLLSLQLLPTKIKKSSRYLLTTALILLFNIAFIRATGLLCYYSNLGSKLLSMSFVTFLPPTFLSSLLITPLVDMLGGFICTFFIVSLKTLMFQASLEYFFLDLLVGLLIVYLCRKIYLREGFIKIGLKAYTLLAVLVAFYSLLAQHLNWIACCQQVLAVYISGFVTILMVILLLPVCEKCFGNATNITFLELTDYNHPLLRKLQILAPGTYHHSLMVASLAENVANEIKANALLCRCCALYHDIGKLIKPEYFTENQKDGENPHEHQTPSMSAVILKSHVKEGVELAKSYNLPQEIISVIQQHHGTSIMQYFYNKALRQQEANGGTVDPLVFRYDGPKPQFKESAIISLADAVEAASRSLTKVSAQAVTELIESVVKERIESGQLNECSVTLKEINQLKKSFQFTLLNMLHARVSYSADADVEEGEEKH